MACLRERARYFTTEEVRLLLDLIAERMEIDDRDELARKRWARKVRQLWPLESYSGRLEATVGERLRGARRDPDLPKQRAGLKAL